MDFLDNLEVAQDFIDNLQVYRKYNEVISNYFFRMSHDYKKEHFKNLGTRVDECNRVWHIDHYIDINIKELKKTHLCHNKFCFNCKKVVQALRMAKYSDVIRSQPNIYHLVLTSPSVKGDDLQATIKKMAKTFRRLYYILADKDKFKIPFSEICVIGALRSLEITYNKNGFHPHYHVILVLDHKIELKKHIIHPKFSYSYGNLNRVFSEFEIYIQKMWYLLMNDLRLSEDNFKSNCGEHDGYSCTIDEFHEDDFIEIFKYLCKEADFIDIDDNGLIDEQVKFILPYHHFVTLYNATYRVKQIQGYGTLYRIKDDFDVEEMQEHYEAYTSYLSTLSDVVKKYEYLSLYDFDKHIEKLKNRGFNDEDIQGFRNNFSTIDLTTSKYISFKKYVAFVTKLPKE